MKVVIRLFIVLLFAGAIKTQAQQVNFEQRAVNYFFESLFSDNYPNVEMVQFGGSTEKVLTEFGLFKNCFSDEDQIRKGLYDVSHGKSLPEKGIDVSGIENIHFRNRKVKSKIRMLVLQASQVDGKVYVAIQLIKQLHYTDAYFFELDQSGDILRWCKTGMVH